VAIKAARLATVEDGEFKIEYRTEKERELSYPSGCSPLLLWQSQSASTHFWLPSVTTGSKFRPVTFASRADWFGDHIWSFGEIPDLAAAW
jgi:hypothetical protein